MGLFKKIFRAVTKVALPAAAVTFPGLTPVLAAVQTAKSYISPPKTAGQSMAQAPPAAGPVTLGGANMSAWDTILQAGKAALPYVPGIIQGLQTGRAPGVMPGGATVSGFGGFGLPVQMPGLAAPGRGIGRMRSVNRSASTYCRRHPGWCTQVGGLGAVANMVAGGQLPLTRSSRGRGISSRELRAFRKVHRVLRRIKIKTR